jgi:hypothetical protein
MTPAHREAIRAGARASWLDAEKRARPIEGMRRGWDDPLRLAMAREARPRTGRNVSEGYNEYHRAYRRRCQAAESPSSASEEALG